jgi:hypothetical protein
VRKASFDLPLALENHFYPRLEKSGYSRACRTQVPDEWVKGSTENPAWKSLPFIRLAHVAGIVEIHFNPHGKGVARGYQSFLWPKNTGDVSDFVVWLGEVLDRIKLHGG